MQDSFFSKIKISFQKSMRGEEDLKILVRYWGIIGYLLSYFVLNKIAKSTHSPMVSGLIALTAIIYFSWHFYVIIKCSPKKPKISKAEAKELRKAKRQEFIRSFLRKLLLQESFTKWDPIFITKLMDLFCIANFVGFIFR